MEKNRTILSRAHGLMILKCLSVLTFVVLVWHEPLWGADAESVDGQISLEQILSNIKESELKVKTFTASFKQFQQNHLLMAPLVSRGLMSYDHSGKLLMEISHPEPYVILLNDRMIIMGDPVKKTFKKKSFPGRDALLKRYMGAGQPIEVLKQKYDIRLVNDCTGTDCRLDLVPKKRDRKMPFQFIRVTIDTRQWLPKRIRLEEPNNDYTEFELSYLTINSPLPEDLFTIDLSSEELDDPLETNK